MTEAIWHNTDTLSSIIHFDSNIWYTCNSTTYDLGLHQLVPHDTLFGATCSADTNQLVMEDRESSTVLVEGLSQLTG